MLGLSGCAGSSPTTVNFYKYVEREQYDKAASLFSGQALNTTASKTESMLQMQAAQIQQAGGIKNFKVTDQTIINDRAVVYFEITTGDGNVTPGSVNLAKMETGK
jgi:hypothetical protein